MKYLTSVAVILFVLFGYLEAAPFPGRCRNRQVSKCAWKKMRQRRFPEPQDRLRVVWSSDGLVGNRYFERDGKHFVEIQELVPIGNGRYRIVSREEETTPPPAAPQLPQEPSGAGSGPRSWMDELAAVPAWPVSRVEDPRESGARQQESRVDEPRPAPQQVHPQPRSEPAQVQPEHRPEPMPVQPEPRPVPQETRPEEPREEDHSHADDERQHPQSRVIGPAQPQAQPEPAPVRSEDQAPSGAEQPPRELVKLETPAAGVVVAVPIRQRTEDFPEKPAAYYDETWYEPPGQTFYPRLLYSPRYGWREMTQDEVSRLRSIRPISEHEQSNGRDIHPQMELHPSHPQNVQPVQQTDAEPKQDQKATILTQNIEQKEDEDSPNNILHGQQGTWIFRNDKWEFEPRGAVEVAETTPESIAPVYDSGTWVYDNGAWHYRPLSQPFETRQEQPDREQRRPDQEQRQPDQKQTRPDQEQRRPDEDQRQSDQDQRQPDQEQAQPDQAPEQLQPEQEPEQTQPVQEQRISIPAVTVDENQETGEKKLVKVKKFPRAPDYQDNHRELSAKAVTADHEEEENRDNRENDRDAYSRWYHSHRREQNEPQERENTWNAQETKALSPIDGQLPQSDSAYYLQNGNMAAVVYSEKDHDKPEVDERNKAQGASYFLKEGNLGAYVYSGDENSSSGREERNDQAPPPPRYLSADEYKRLQPSEVKIPTLQLKDPSDLKPCDGTAPTSGNGEFWLLRTRPCNRNSPEGRIMLPNGEILRFFGQPQLVNV